MHRSGVFLFMSTLSIRLSKEDAKLLKEYVQINNLNMSQFIPETIIDKIEDDFNLDEARILHAWEVSEKEKKYSHQEVWEILDV